LRLGPNFSWRQGGREGGRESDRARERGNERESNIERQRERARAQERERERKRDVTQALSYNTTRTHFFSCNHASLYVCLCMFVFDHWRHYFGIRISSLHIHALEWCTSSCASLLLSLGTPFAHTNIHTHSHTHTHTCTHTHTHIHTHTQTHTHTRTHTHTHTHKLRELGYCLFMLLWYASSCASLPLPPRLHTLSSFAQPLPAQSRDPRELGYHHYASMLSDASSCAPSSSFAHPLLIHTTTSCAIARPARTRISPSCVHARLRWGYGCCAQSFSLLPLIHIYIWIVIH